MAPLVVKNNPNWQWSALLLTLIALGIFGFLTKVLMGHQLAQVSLWLYLVLGWGQVVAFGPLLWQLPNVLAWILIEDSRIRWAMSLTLDIRRYHFHTIWHIFVSLECVPLPRDLAVGHSCMRLVRVPQLVCCPRCPTDPAHSGKASAQLAVLIRISRGACRRMHSS